MSPRESRPPREPAPETAAKQSEASVIVRFTCRHYRDSSRLAERHLRAAGVWRPWQRRAFVTGMCRRCGGEWR